VRSCRELYLPEQSLLLSRLKRLSLWLQRCSMPIHVPSRGSRSRQFSSYLGCFSGDKLAGGGGGEADLLPIFCRGSGLVQQYLQSTTHIHFVHNGNSTLLLLQFTHSQQIRSLSTEGRGNGRHDSFRATHIAFRKLQ
jgi:hypothetical protein